jgi:hypothetical protein
MLPRFLFFLSIFFIAVSCEQDDPCKGFELGKPFEIDARETVKNCLEDISITMLPVEYDSRCPLGAMCVWSGYAKIDLLFSSLGKEISLSLSTDPGLSQIPNKVSVEGYSFQLIELNPYPALGNEANPKEYKAKLLIESVLP